MSGVMNVMDGLQYYRYNYIKVHFNSLRLLDSLIVLK